MKLFNGKYEVIAETNQYILREHIITKTGKEGTKDRYSATFDGIVYMVLEREKKTVVNSKEWTDLDKLSKALIKSNEKVRKELKELVQNG